MPAAIDSTSSCRGRIASPCSTTGRRSIRGYLGLAAIAMTCPRCQTDNPLQANFCLECAAPLRAGCANCGTILPPTAKFCYACAHPVGSPRAHDARWSSPDAYTPRHLAEAILTSKAALEGERKQVTVLFADLKGSMELLADRDPEEARQILDPVLEHMMEAVHRYEGTVNQVMGDGIMALFGAPVAHEDHALRACYAALRMQERIKRYAEEVRRSQAAVVRIRVGLNSGKSSCAPSAAICAWTTRRSGRRHT